MNMLHRVFLLILSLFSISCHLYAQPHTTFNGVTGNWEDNTMWKSLSEAITYPTITGSSYTINGTITRNGDLNVTTNLTVNDYLYVMGNVSATGGSITVKNGGTLYIYGNLSSNVNINVELGGTLIVLGSVNVTGGTVDMKGNVIVGGNFTSSSNTTLYQNGNVVIGGNFNMTSGNITLNGSAANNTRFYVIGGTSQVTTPYSTPICTVTSWSPFTETCDYGNYTNLQTSDNTLWLQVNQVLGLSCGITISTEPSNISSCGGSSSSFSVSAAGATDYQWQVDNGTGYVNLSNTGVYSGVTSAVLSISNTTGLSSYSYRCKLSSATCTTTSYAGILTVLGTTPTAPSTVGVSRCGIGAVTLSASGAGTGENYKWYDAASAGNLVKTNGSTYTFTSLATTTLYVSIYNTTTGCESSRVSVTAIINPLLAASVAISASANPACAGATINFAVVPTNGGVSPAYQWKVNGANVGTSASNYSYIPTNGDAVLCVMSSNAICATGTPATSNSIAMTVTIPVTPSVSISTSPSASVCAGTNVTFTAIPTNGGTPSYQWKINGLNVGTNTNTFAVNYLTGSDIVSCVMTSSLCSSVGTNPSTSNSVGMTIWYNNIAAPTFTPTSLCAGGTVNVSFNVPCDFPSPNTFTVQLSDATGSFSSPVSIGSVPGYTAGTYNIAATVPNGTATGAGYLIRIVSSYPTSTSGFSVPSSSALQVYADTGVPISPSTFGNGSWNVFCYKENTVPLSSNVYMGYYTENNLSFNTTNRWTSGTSPANANTSSGLGYIGCTSLPGTYISMSFKRTNISCGYYQIDIPSHDDMYDLIIDGVTVSTHNGCCDAHTNVWTGWLSPSKQVELRLYQGGGGSYLAANFTLLSSPLAISPNATVCSGSPATLTASWGTPSPTYSWSPATYLSSSIGSSVVATPTATATYTVTATDATLGCSSTGTVTVNVSTSVTLNVSASPTTSVCSGINSTTLTATGANTYTWTPSTGLSATTGASVVASPSSTVTYTVTGSIGCALATKTITITGQTPPGGAALDTSSYGNGTWNALCYNSTNFTNYYGYYTENTRDFNSTSRWATGRGPTVANAATGLAYTGCTFSGLNYSIRFKRTNVPCGYYSLTVNYTDDDFSFWVDGVKVYSSGYVPSDQSNVWTGFVGPTTKLELRLTNYSGPGRLQVSFAPASITSMSAPVTICAGTSANLSISAFPSATYTWSAIASIASWLSSTSGTSVAVTPPLATPSSINYFVCTVGDTKTGCTVKDSIKVSVNPIPSTSVTPTSTTVYCPSSNTTLTASGANTYSWSPSTGLSATTGNVVTASPAVTTTYTVGGNNNCSTVNATSTITVVPLIDETTYPSGKWNAYGYNTQTFSGYQGFYSATGTGTTGLDFSTDTQWGVGYGPSSSMATGGTAYIGCNMGVDYFSMSFKRTGFTCGFYQIDVTGHDDAAYLYVDGALAWSHIGCCDSHTDVWSGFLFPTSKVEFKLVEGGGSAYLRVKFSSKSPVFSSVSTNPSLCSTSSVPATLSVSAYGAGNTYSWSPATGLSATTGASVNALPSTTTTYTVLVSNCGGTVSGDTTITVNILLPSVINTQPVHKSLCSGFNTNFSITSSNTLFYQWEVSTNGGSSWSDVPNSGIYSGATSQLLTLTSVPLASNGYKYRCRTTNWACSTIWSSEALLTVISSPSPVYSTSSSTVCTGSIGNLYTTQSGKSDYQWTVTGGTISSGGGSANNSVTVTWGVTGTGHVMVNYTDTNGCASPSATDWIISILAVPNTGPAYRRPNN